MRRMQFSFGMLNRLAWVLTGLLVAQGCSGPKVNGEPNPSADPWMYHTYAWADAPAEAIRHSANRDLADMGLMELQSTDIAPDFYIRPAVSATKLTFTFIDAKTERVFWTGTATGEIEKNPAQAADRLISNYRGTRDHDQSAAAKAAFYANTE